MPPGKGFYGRKEYAGRQKGERKLAPLYLLAALPVLGIAAWAAMGLFGGGDAGDPATDDGQSVQDERAEPTPTSVPIAPTRNPATRAGGSHEGTAILPANPPKPGITEYLIAGGKRFEAPLAAHAGVEDDFGTDRGDGLRHAGVDFSLVGLKNIPVESACDGTVESTGTDDNYGLHVIVDCGAGFTTVYGWLGSVRVAQGNLVSKSAVVGTGEPDGFLHFEIRYNGVPIDPADFVQVPGREVIPWTPTPTPTRTPTPTLTPEATETPTPKPTLKPGQTPSPEETPEPGPPTATPTLG
ncbi:MAG TPA: M23 family metallopeptidase, partial [Tepidiformaceae bacterium]|nr:M23 family metallopeptidase [Tepidiformaceae bacterium]